MKKDILYPWLAAILLLLSSCAKPLAPETPQDEPDTAKSYVRAYVQTPNLNQIWEMRNRDTLSKTIVGGVSANGIMFTRSGELACDNVYCLKFASGFSFVFKNVRDLEIRTQRNVNSVLLYGQIDSLRSWKQEKLTFQFETSANITGEVTTSVSSGFGWSEFKVQENFAPPASNNASQEWTIVSFHSNVVDVQYNVVLSKNDYMYRSTIDSAYVTITNYDSIKKRISGRFSFKVVGSINKEVIELRDGVFENVQVLMR
jgi:hypothetical protein